MDAKSGATLKDLATADASTKLVRRGSQLSAEATDFFPTSPQKQSPEQAAPPVHFIGGVPVVPGSAMIKPPDPPVSSDNASSELELLSTELRDRIVRQVEYWMSDENLKSDDYILKRMRGGWIPIRCLATPKKMKRLTKNFEFVADSLRTSTKLIVSADGQKVSRKIPFSLERALSAEIRTVMVSNLPDDMDLSELLASFSQSGDIEHANIVQPRVIANPKNPERYKPRKPYAFVRYVDLESAIVQIQEDETRTGWRADVTTQLQCGLSPEEARAKLIVVELEGRELDEKRAMLEALAGSTLPSDDEDEELPSVPASRAPSRRVSIELRGGNVDLGRLSEEARLMLNRLNNDSSNNSRRDSYAGSGRLVLTEMNGSGKKKGRGRNSTRGSRRGSTASGTGERFSEPALSAGKWKSYGNRGSTGASNQSSRLNSRPASRDPSPDTWRNSTSQRPSETVVLRPSFAQEMREQREQSGSYASFQRERSGSHADSLHGHNHTQRERSGSQADSRNRSRTNSIASNSTSNSPQPTAKKGARSQTGSRASSPVTDGSRSSTSPTPKKDGRSRGVVHNFFGDCGFIKPEKKKQHRTIYFSSKDLAPGTRSLKVGDKVEFSLRHDRKTHEPSAHNVIRVGGAEAGERHSEAPGTAPRSSERESSPAQAVRWSEAGGRPALGVRANWLQAKGPDGTTGFGRGRGRGTTRMTEMPVGGLGEL